MKEFMTNAVGFTKNPLGIIGLFISLIYGCSSFVMTSTECLDRSERLIFIWFLVIFPIVVLAAFIYLVVYHHKKLYGPGDYKDEKNFVVSYLPDTYQGFKRAQELDVNEELNEEEKSQIEKNHNINIRTEMSNGKNNSINIKSLVNLASNTVKSIQEQYLLVENQILDSLELELGSPVKRNVSINFQDSTPITIDGVNENKDKITFIEVKYPQFGLIGKGFQIRAEQLIRDVFIVNKGNFKSKKINIVFAIGVQNEYRNILENRLEKIKSRLSIPSEGIEFRVFEIE